MTALTGLGMLEIAVLTAVLDLGGTPGAVHRGTTRVLDRLEAEEGIGPAIVCHLAAGVDVDVAEQWVRSVGPVTIEVDGAPLRPCQRTSTSTLRKVPMVVADGPTSTRAVRLPANACGQVR